MLLDGVTVTGSIPTRLSSTEYVYFNHYGDTRDFRLDMVEDFGKLYLFVTLDGTTPGILNYDYWVSLCT
jgi:hypothetical protein